MCTCDSCVCVCVFQAFAQAASQTVDHFQKDQAPLVIKNRLGLAVSVLHSETFSPIDTTASNQQVELQDGESLNMDYTSTTTGNDQFSAMTSLSSKDYFIQPSECMCTYMYTIDTPTAL